jgi:hypothetical protein
MSLWQNRFLQRNSIRRGRYVSLLSGMPQKQDQYDLISWQYKTSSYVCFKRLSSCAKGSF